MLRLCVVALSCLCAARASPPDRPAPGPPAGPLAGPAPLRPHTHLTKELSSILSGIDERLRMLDTISAVQAKQARRLDVIQDKLERVETTLSLRLERAQLAAERLEHRLHMLQTSVQASIKESGDKVERSHAEVAVAARNLTAHLASHRQLLEKVSGAYVETWRRGLMLEALARDGLALANVTRRELADGLRALARRRPERLADTSRSLDKKLQEVVDTQRRLLESCAREQLDGPAHVADVLDRLLDSLINKTAATFHELQNIQMTMRSHDTRVMKLLTSGRNEKGDATCRRLETVFRNSSQSNFKEQELKQLTEKFIALTERADLALQRLEAGLGGLSGLGGLAGLGGGDGDGRPASDVTAEADRLLLKLKGIRTEQETTDEDDDWEEDEDTGYYDDSGGDLMEEDANLLSKYRDEWRHEGVGYDARKSEYEDNDLQKGEFPDRQKLKVAGSDIRKGKSWRDSRQAEPAKARPPHRRHPHKHPYDRGPA